MTSPNVLIGGGLMIRYHGLQAWSTSLFSPGLLKELVCTS